MSFVYHCHGLGFISSKLHKFCTTVLHWDSVCFMSFTPISSFEENVYIISTFIITPLSLIGTVIIYASLHRTLCMFKNSNNLNNMDNEYYAINTGLSSVLCSILVCLFKMFLSNNLLIPWNYGDNSNHFVSSVDSLENCTATIGKITFYFTLTFYLKSLINSLTQIDSNNYFNHYIITFLRIWMCAMAGSILILGFGFIAGDMMEHSSKEIGITQKHKFHITNVTPKDDTSIISIYSFLILCIEAIYYILLTYLYLNHLGSV